MLCSHSFLGAALCTEALRLSGPVSATWDAWPFHQAIVPMGQWFLSVGAQKKRYGFQLLSASFFPPCKEGGVEGGRVREE